MPKNRFSNYICLDLETTGLEPQICDVIEIAMIKVRDGEIVDRFETFVYTPLEISEHISYLTGIRAQDIEKSPDFVTLIPRIEQFIGDDPLVGHNIWFDWNFLVQKGVKLEKNELWDTYVMSNILYPELPSHSLETNTKYFGISHEDSHRAMADVMASHELWKILMEASLMLTSEQRQQVEDLQKRSTWPLLEFFLQEKPAYKHPLSVPETSLYHPQRLEKKDVNARKDHLFIHARGYDPVDMCGSLQTAAKTLYIAGYEHTLEKLQQMFPNAYRLLSPYSYLSAEKRDKLWQKPKLEDGETTLLLKTILYPQVITREQLGLSHPERNVWRDVQVNLDEIDQENTYQKAHQASLQAEKVIVSQFHVLNHPEYLEHFDQLVILEPQLLEDNATTTWGKALYLEQWLEQSKDESWQRQGEQLFAQVNKLGSTMVPASQYPEHVILTDMIIQSNEFIRMRSSVVELSEATTDPELAAYLKYYLAFFQSQDVSWVRWFTVDPRRGVSIHVAPLSVASLLKKHLFDRIPTVIVSDTADHFSAFPDMEQWEMTKKQDFKLVLPDLDCIKGTKKEGDHPAIISYLAEEIPKLTGKTGVIFASKSVLKRYFFDLVKVLPEHILMLGEDISGGTGKLRDRYLTGSQDHKVLFLTYRNLRTFPPEALDFDQILVQCLPFDPPGYPVHQARSAQVENSFMDYALPKTQQNMLEIVSNFTHRTSPKHLFILDRRVQEQQYGEDILKTVQ